MFNKTILGLRLRLLREKLNLKQEDVADRIGCHRGTIGNIERGAKAPSIEMLVALSNFFGVTVDYLLGTSDSPSSVNHIEKSDMEYNKATKTEVSSGQHKSDQKKLDALTEGLDEESMRELRKYITFLHTRQTLNDGEDESSAGLDGK